MAGLPAEVRRLRFAGVPPISAVAGGASVVALGENNHYIREFTVLRTALLRVLVEELGFGVVAVESGFPEGRLVDDWVRGGPGDARAVARGGFTFRFADPPEMVALLRWLREHNTAGGRVRFAGLDVPGSGGSPLPALRQVRDHLAEHAAGDVALADAAVEATRPYAAANNSAALARYATLSPAQRDAATAALSRLWLRMDALPLGPDPRGTRIARHAALGALRLDEHLRELSRLAPAEAATLACSSRDVYMAETVRLLRLLHGPGARIAMLAHNAHAQRVPMRLLPNVVARPAGAYLAEELGEDYLAVGVTALGGTTADAQVDDNARLGFTVGEQPLGPPAEDSVEHAIAGEGLAAEPVLLDLRPARGANGPSSIRHVAAHAPVDVLAAFDALICLPETSASRLD
ncbi:erythromycin esterase family protein [Prauserella muralis]|uniref:Uncharacterized protein n=1 Tax=Prauserella muralis TaxID=588067 RepID=A0A2V4AQC7_9PSEU|nr:erythromycin esterase family protein [Prauserella muralis]PXY22698.1 hypothetical protein BAY60_23070 [Prauserella muralis]TWE28415.1 erythromycin esterase [Prauserella muralis]